MSAEKEIDEATGVETTGHRWDGDLKELNKPLPKWWLMTFYATIVWAIGYWLLFPAWPTFAGYTQGLLEYSQRGTVAEEVATARQAQSGNRDKLVKTAYADIRKDADLLRFATAAGAAAFGANCAPCHGRGAQGAVGYPNLNDDDWLWGGSVEAVQQTIETGIRSADNKDTRFSEMPKFGIDKILDEKQIADAAQYVLSLSGAGTDKAAAGRGQAIFAEQCVACHGEDGKGNPELGAPNLTDAIWLFGGTKEAVAQSITTGRGGVMPAWGAKLDPATIKSLTVYVHSLGGGQ